jgi:tyrosyl-tRNA synthetase
MLHRESVKTRLHEREQGISYTEFSYMLLQGYDFAALSARYGCTLQMGGSDQWGNIVSGVELTRKLHKTTAYGLTTPLLTKADGTKYGKSEKGNVWLDPALTSPYEFYQFLFNADDADVEKLLLQLSLVPLDEISAVMAEHGASPSRRAPQRKLAEAVTRFVHGDDGLAVALRITRAFFGDVSWRELSPDELNVAWRTQTHAPEMVGDALGAPVGELTEALVSVGLFTSKSDARRGIEGGGVSINGVKVDRKDVKRALGGLDVLSGGYMVLSKGAKNHRVVRVA